MVSAFFIACVLLAVGFILRVQLRALQVLYVPASIAGGIIGLILIQTIGWFWETSLGTDRSHLLAGPSSWMSEPLIRLSQSIFELRSWPGWLIAVVFAGLLLDKQSRPLGQSLHGALRQGLMVWIISLGQVALGLMVTWLIIQPLYPDVPNSFGMLIETGFAGGHGTAAAMGLVFDELDFPMGRDLGTFMATAGIAFSVLSGMVYVNLAVRRGWTRSGNVSVTIITGMEDRSAPTPIGLSRVRDDVLDPLVFQTLILMAAILLGLLMHELTAQASGWKLPFLETNPLQKVPLFIFTLIGGLCVRKCMDHFNMGDLIDSQSIRRLTSTAMEFLIVAAIVSLNLEAVIQLLIPLSVLLLAGFVWTGICLLWIGKKLLPKQHWFELGIINYGMSTGTTANGLALLRIVDKDLESGAAEEYALAAPLSAPFVGGGILTLILPDFLENHAVSLGIPAFCVTAVVLMLFFTARKISLSQST